MTRFDKCVYIFLFYIHVSISYSKTNMYYKKGEYECCRGPPGLHGNPGIPGGPGTNGQNGLNGEKGQKGDRGDEGLMGKQGSIGSPGHQGEKGKRGKKGNKGSKGNNGEIGGPGPMGPIGLKGFKGQRGYPAYPTPQVAFSVRRTNPLGPVTEDTTITYNKIYLNIGDSFDTYSSHFVAKLNGTYLFTAHVLSSADYSAYAWMTVNNRPIVPMHGDHRAGYGTGSNTFMYHLVYDDHVWVQLMKNSSLLNDYSTFSGYLIYKD